MKTRFLISVDFCLFLSFFFFSFSKGEIQFLLMIEEREWLGMYNIEKCTMRTYAISMQIY